MRAAWGTTSTDHVHLAKPNGESDSRARRSCFCGNILRGPRQEARDSLSSWVPVASLSPHCDASPAPPAEFGGRAATARRIATPCTARETCVGAQSPFVAHGASVRRATHAGARDCNGRRRSCAFAGASDSRHELGLRVAPRVRQRARGWRGSSNDVRAPGARRAGPERSRSRGSEQVFGHRAREREPMRGCSCAESWLHSRRS